MARWIFGIIIGMGVGLLVGLSIEQGFTAAVWGFLGVLVGGSVTIFVEHMRTEGERRKRLAEWKLAALTKLGETTDELDRAAGVVMSIRLEDVNRNDRFRTVHQLAPQAHAFGQAMRRHTLSSGVYLGEGLSNAAKAFREGTAALTVFKSDWITDIDQPLTDDEKERLRADLTEISGPRVELFEEMEKLRSKMIAEIVNA